MDLVIWIVVLLASLTVLIKSSDYFTDCAEKIGLFLGIPAFIVGVTIVAFGTSLPELISSVLAVVRDTSEIVVGNVVGSNITNIFLILGLTAIVGQRLKVTYEITHVDLPLMVGAAFLVAVTVWDGAFTLPDALLCLAGIVIYLRYTMAARREAEDVETEEGKLDLKTLMILVASGAFIYLGANYTVESIIKLSEILDIGEEIIAVSAVALGTSLPELTVGITAARKGKPEIAIGNVLGSNIFNSFAVMGIPALFGTLTIPNSILTASLPIMLIATLLFFFVAQEKVVTKWEGWLLVIFYVFFIGKIFDLF
ncbi:MAG: calcium/sodium antiporter [Candidatus Bipolaricaulia bacterium]